jgi:regulator of replication initiation timing
MTFSHVWMNVVAPLRRGISTHMAGHQNRAFERHFQEISKVRADRRKLKEENETLRAENARLRGRVR